MDRVNSGTKFVSGYSYIQELQENPLLLLAEVSCLQLSGLVHSVQISTYPSHSGYLNRQVNHQDTHGYLRQLCSFSVSHVPATEKESYVSSLTKGTQQQVPTKTFQFKKTEPSGYGNPLPLVLKKMTASELDKARRARSQAKYSASDKGKAARTRYTKSDKGKATRAKYLRSDKGKVAKAIINAKSAAYRAALRKGLSEKLAREKGELAARAKRQNYRIGTNGAGKMS
ncbi:MULTISPECIES: hypothetical protein [unclassified Endozoicomonas]|uniref:hypothetical protein n=1 Tax=unclassified Endozoicomonas TaxID=2644528 RepID=UPI003BB7F16D